MSFLGYLTWKRTGSSLVLSIIYAAAGTNMGSILAYAIGLKYGERILVKYGRYVHITKDNIDNTKKLFNKNEVLLLFD